MSDLPALQDGEAVVIPADLERGIALVANIDPELLGRPMGADRLAVGRLLEVANYGFAADAARKLMDGSLVRLAPETVEQLRSGLDFARDAKGMALGMMRTPGGQGVAAQARFITGAANPVAAAMMLQTMVVQRQLRSIEKALEKIDRKIDALHKAHKIKVLADALALFAPINEMRSKIDAGARLSPEDETQLRALDLDARKTAGQARLWLQHLEPLASRDQLSLAAQHGMLVDALGSEHVAFWVRPGLVSDVALVQILLLRSHRADSAEDPQWAVKLRYRNEKEIVLARNRVLSLHNNMDRYLRNSDIADRLEELAFRRKRAVRRRRRELMGVSNALRECLIATSDLFYAATGEPVPMLPGPLDRRTVEPRFVRDRLYDGANVAGRVVGERVTTAGRAAGGGATAAGRALGTGVGAARSAATRAEREARRRLQR